MFLLFTLCNSFMCKTQYDPCNKVMPTLDAIQSKLGLTNEQLRTLVLRSPSVIGVGAISIDGQLSTLDQRLHFFQDEGEKIA